MVVDISKSITQSNIQVTSVNRGVNKKFAQVYGELRWTEFYCYAEKCLPHGKISGKNFKLLTKIWLEKDQALRSRISVPSLPFTAKLSIFGQIMLTILQSATCILIFVENHIYHRQSSRELRNIHQHLFLKNVSGEQI